MGHRCFFRALGIPKTWAGSSSQTHIHVYAALFLGGLITGFPAVLTLVWPGRVLTRHAVAVGQMLVSALFIHLTGGRIEAHFHVFGSLASILSEQLHDSKIVRLTEAAALMQANEQDLAAFLTNDPKGKLVPSYVINLSEHLLAEHQALFQEFESLARNVEHIKEIVAMQQSYATACGVREVLPAADLVEDALRMNAGALGRHEVEIIREYAEVPPLPLDKHKDAILAARGAPALHH